MDEFIDYATSIKLADDVAERIRKRRNKLGYTITEMAEYLAPEWGLKKGGAIVYITDLERGIVLGYLSKINPSNKMFSVHKNRISDIIRALGFNKNEENEIINYIKKLNPHFEFQSSVNQLPSNEIRRNYKRLIKKLEELEAINPELVKNFELVVEEYLKEYKKRRKKR